MNIETFREYCLQKKAVTESFPFDETTLVYKVAGKMFALTSLDNTVLTVNLKCDPDWAIELRESYPQITPGFHMNKKHWNTVHLTEGFPLTLFIELITHSYQLVVASLPKKTQIEFNL